MNDNSGSGSVQVGRTDTVGQVFCQFEVRPPWHKHAPVHSVSSLLVQSAWSCLVVFLE